MCATKPSTSWPHSPSRSSSSDCALLGIRSSPRHGLAPGTSSGRLACGVIAIGRVCGTAIGTEPMATTRLTPSRSTTSRTARAKASQRLSGSGPCSSRYAVPPLSCIRRTDQPRRVVGLVVVTRRRSSRADGRGSRGTRRRRRSPPPGRVSTTGVEVGQVPSGVCGGVAGVEEPVEDEHHRQVGDPGELGDLVDDVHEPFGGHRSSFSDRGPARAVGVDGRRDRPAVGQGRHVLDDADGRWPGR